MRATGGAIEDAVAGAIDGAARVPAPLRLWLKACVVGVLTLALLIPLAMVGGVIADRQQYRAQAVADVARGFGGAQAVAGPVLVVPYTDVVDVEETGRDGVARRVRRSVEGRWTFFPTSLDVRGPLRPDVRRRGLHAVRVYEWDAALRAHFDVRVPVDAGAGTRTVGRPWLSVGIADVRGVRASPVVRVDGVALPVEQGLGSGDGSGLHVRLDAPAAGARLAFATDVQLRVGGTESLALVPLARSNRFELASTWPHPGFFGQSPGHDVSAQGFRATWQITSIGTDAQRQYREGALLPTRAPPGMSPAHAVADGLDAVGVSLVDPVDAYTLADRATKYGVLFVVLTFAGFFLFELIRQLPIHPIQYGLVGLALGLFFLLLVALSEHVPFGLAYLAAAAACIGLLAFYLVAVLRSVARGLGFAAMLATLYAALYGLLVSEDNALVLGAGLLFVILAAAMAITRRVDWYGVAAGAPPPVPAGSRAPDAPES